MNRKSIFQAIDEFASLAVPKYTRRELETVMASRLHCPCLVLGWDCNGCPHENFVNLTFVCDQSIAYDKVDAAIRYNICSRRGLTRSKWLGRIRRWDSILKMLLFCEEIVTRANL